MGEDIKDAEQSKVIDMFKWEYKRECQQNEKRLRKQAILHPETELSTKIANIKASWLRIGELMKELKEPK